MAFMLVVDLVVGVRLLMLARRTRELPELAFGTGFVLLGAIGYPLATVARGIALDAPETGGPLLLAAIGTQDLACFAIYVAVARVFRPTSALAKGCVAAAAALLALSWIGQVASGAPDGGPFFLVGWAMRGGCFAWSTAEALACFDRMRRRLALGLADPLIVDRFRLWAVANGAITVGFAIFMAGRLAAPPGAGQLPAVTALTSLVGIVAGVALWLAFVPPDAYVRRVRGASPAGPAA